MMHDGVSFAVLCAVTAALFAGTLLLFRSFERHREALGQRWSERGRDALQQARPEEAVMALRTALSYEPDQWEDQLLLARALAESGRVEEATGYFLNLWEQRPGDGFINLQLARLERKKGDAQEATNSYRASIFGTWDGDGAERRREVRLELASYLAGRGDLASARAEILIAAGNAPKRQGLEVAFGDQLEAIHVLPDALALYRKALAQDPGDRVALEKAGRTAYQMGDFGAAHRYLADALRHSGADSVEVAELEHNSERAQELNLSRELPADDRAAHMQVAATIAQARLAACGHQMMGASAGVLPDVLLPLDARWAAMRRKVDKREMARDAALADEVNQLIDETEVQARESCGEPAGDDAVLLMLAKQTGGR